MADGSVSIQVVRIAGQTGNFAIALQHSKRINGAYNWQTAATVDQSELNTIMPITIAADTDYRWSHTSGSGVIAQVG